MGGRQRVRAVALTAVLGLGLMACGDDGGDDAATQDTSGADATTKTTPSDSEADSADVDLGDFTGECADFAQTFSNAGTAIGQAFTEGDADQVQAVADYFDEVSSKVPEEIRDDFGVYADAFGEFAQGLADAGIDFSDPSTVDQEKLSQLEVLSQAFSSPEVTKASENIQAYVAENCQGG